MGRPFGIVLPLLAICACTPGIAQTEPVEPFPYVEVHTGGAATTDSLPLIVALHGRGDRPEWFASLFDDYPAPARVVVLRPPHPFGDGLAWYLDGRQSSASRARIARELLAHAARVRATVLAVQRARSTRGRPSVMGFSQGAMLTYTIAATQPDTFAAAYPISGFFFRETPRGPRIDPSRLPRIVAWHGRRDRLVTLDDDHRGIERLRSMGITVDLHEHDGAHTLPPAVRQSLFTLLRGQDRPP